METTSNLKRRRDSGEGAAKKICGGPSCTEDPLEGPSNAYPQMQPLPQQVPNHLLLLAPFPPLSLPPPPLPLPPMFPPPESLQPSQYSQPPLLQPKPPLPTDQAHIEAPPFHPQLKNIRPHQIVHVRRAQSLERQSPPSIIRTYSLPSLSPISSPELFPERTPPQDKPSQQQEEEKKAPNSAEEKQENAQKTMYHRLKCSNGPSIKKNVKTVTATRKNR